ncbi:high mobility group box domain-containing protein [Mycena sp. CBHHK59/15]|nr:high mobility group box domain-containing protein [Mycena sp. CBHHK59/15]
MPPIRDHTILYTFLGDEDERVEGEGDDDEDDEEEDRDMPPLVDAPPMAQTQESMMSSFDFAFAPPVFAPSPVLPPSAPAAAARGTPGASGRGRRAPSYIPRPPNAFILFRSSFIRSQNVPGRVEGNHSTLSKIIGKYWKTLPPDERARWEDRARAAQAEHRRRYPDWRFRPGTVRTHTRAGAGVRARNPRGGARGGSRTAVAGTTRPRRRPRLYRRRLWGSRGTEGEVGKRRHGGG